MKINILRFVFQNNVFLVYFPVKKHQKTLKLTLGMLIFQFWPNFWIPWVKISLETYFSMIEYFHKRY